jgi:uncharacterized membrane protein
LGGWLSILGLLFGVILLVLTVVAIFYLLVLVIDDTVLRRRKKKRRRTFVDDAIAYRMKQMGETEVQARAAVEGRLTAIIQETIMRDQ